MAYTDFDEALKGLAALTGDRIRASKTVALNRGNHTGSQTASTISDFAAAVDARIAAAGGGPSAATTLTPADIQSIFA